MDSLRFVDDERFMHGLSEGYIAMAGNAVGLNIKDVTMSLGQILPEPRSGEEASGVVSQDGRSESVIISPLE